MSNYPYWGNVNQAILSLMPQGLNTVVDVGCGDGSLGITYKHDNPDTYYCGIEMHISAAEKAALNLDRVVSGDAEQTDLAKLDIMPGTIDCLIYADILEHLKNPWELLSNQTRWLDDAGIVIASIPNIQHWSILTNLLYSNWPYAESGLLDKTHLRFFTINTIKQMFEKAGLLITNLDAIRMPTPPGLAEILRPLTAKMNINWDTLISQLDVFQFIIVAKRKIGIYKLQRFKSTYQATNQTIDVYNAGRETLSIIVPCYQHAEFMTKMFSSIVNQTEKPDEVIFINDHSQDDSLQIIQGIIKADNGFKVTLISNAENLGQSASINKGVETATGDIIMILNDDDYLMHDAVQVVKKLYKEFKNVAAIGAAAIPFDNEAILAQNPYIYSNTSGEPVQLTLHHPRDVLKYRDYNDLNMTHSSSSFLRCAWQATGGYYSDKSARVVPFSDRDFQLRLNSLFTVAVSYSTPFSYWRTNSSVDKDINS